MQHQCSVVEMQLDLVQNQGLLSSGWESALQYIHTDKLGEGEHKQGQELS